MKHGIGLQIHTDDRFLLKDACDLRQCIPAFHMQIILFAFTH